MEPVGLARRTSWARRTGSRRRSKALTSTRSAASRARVRHGLSSLASANARASATIRAMADNDPFDEPFLKFLGKRTEAALKSEKLVDEQIAKLARTATSEPVTITKESAILAAYSASALIERQHLLATEMS